MNLLSVKDLSFEIGGYFAYKHVTFSLSQNEAIGITGDGGSGKTALLETIVGMNDSDSGSVKFASGTRIGFMPQLETEQIDETVSQYLETNRQIAGKLAVSSAQLVDLASFMGMRPYMDRSVENLSMGMKQRVSFLNAVAKRPNVLILDDPFSFQNSFYAHNMMEIIKDLQGHGSGIIIASPMRDTIIEENLNTHYILNEKTLNILPVDQSAYLLAFRATTDSMAITKDIAQYATSSANGLIEIKVPFVQKERVLATMLDMNYLFEGMVSLEV
ncbi:ATP-binding cassette domain-containing protein [Companilactobacillus sp.]|uniref:ATP-binding cassette domain-containing protein n=1 Tax=Companilactobacillus sp. TaxID=2767905 RepID=UPI0026049DBB|nr:ATP-binding cassette domain-containing protein [Companilactobacillus sp.]